MKNNWDKSTGDQECGSCHRELAPGEDVHIQRNPFVLTCSPCVDKAEDELVGRCLDDDRRENDD